jgi:hypothetical protein
MNFGVVDFLVFSFLVINFPCHQKQKRCYYHHICHIYQDEVLCRTTIRISYIVYSYLIFSSLYLIFSYLLCLSYLICFPSGDGVFGSSVSEMVSRHACVSLKPRVGLG